MSITLKQKFNDPHFTYLSEAAIRYDTNIEFHDKIMSCISKCEIILDNWDYLANKPDGYKTRLGPTLFEVDVTDGICVNACINLIGLHLKYMIFKSWDEFRLVDDWYSSILYPVDGPNEYEIGNLFTNSKRKSLLKHVLKCLKDIENNCLH